MCESLGVVERAAALDADVNRHWLRQIYREFREFYARVTQTDFDPALIAIRHNLLLNNLLCLGAAIVLRVTTKAAAEQLLRGGLRDRFTKDVAPLREAPPRLPPQSKTSLVLWLAQSLLYPPGSLRRAT